MATLRKMTYQKAFLLYLLSEVGEIFGDVRLQKILFVFETACEDLRPFRFVRYHYGPYSFELDKVKNLLVSLNWIQIRPVGATVGFKVGSYANSLKKLFDIQGMDEFIRTIRHWRNQTLKRFAYSRDEMKGKKNLDVVINTNLKSRITIPELSQDEAQEIELGLSSKFVDFLAQRASVPSDGISWRRRLAKVFA